MFSIRNVVGKRGTMLIKCLVICWRRFVVINTFNLNSKVVLRYSIKIRVVAVAVLD